MGFAILKFVGKYWWEIAVVLLFSGFVFYVSHINSDRAKLKVTVVEQTRRADQAEADAKAERENFQKAQAASKGYQDELQRLHAAASAAPPRSVRCVVSRPTVPEATTPGGPDATGPGTGSGTEAVGPDIGGKLYDAADSCDVTAARLRGLQAWAKSVSE